MRPYKSLFRLHKEQPTESVFAHFYPIKGDYDEPYKLVARKTMDGYESWQFQQARFQVRHPHSEVPKLRNYLNYTFVRLVELERQTPGVYFRDSTDGLWIAFNTGLQNQHGSDLLAIFERYKARDAGGSGTWKLYPDWVFKGCYAPNERAYRDRFGNDIPDIASYSIDSRDFVFDIRYHLERDVFDHLFDRAKDRAGLPNAPDEVVRNYLRGAIENLIPKIKRNYKVAIPVYYVEEKRMQLLLPFVSASNLNDVSCFLVDRDDDGKAYRLKTIFDLDQAYFRPD